MPAGSTATNGPPATVGADTPRVLLHRLNNQLGVILAHAELLEAKAQDAAERNRASQVVSAAVKAIAVSRELNETMNN